MNTTVNTTLNTTLNNNMRSSVEDKFSNILPLVYSELIDKYRMSQKNNKIISLNISDTESVELSIQAVFIQETLLQISGVSSQNTIQFYVQNKDLLEQAAMLGLDGLPRQMEGQLFLANRLVWRLFCGYHLLDVQSLEEVEINDVVFQLSVNHLETKLFFQWSDLQRLNGLLEQSISNITALYPPVDLSRGAQTEVSPCVGKLLINTDEFLSLKSGDRILIKPYTLYTEAVFDGKLFSTFGGEISQSKICADDEAIYIFSEKYTISYQRLGDLFDKVPLNLEDAQGFLFHPKFQSKIPINFVKMLGKDYIELMDDTSHRL